MKQFKIKSVLVIAAATAIAGLCTAQQLPYTGEVTGDDVYVRSEPNAASYPVTKVSAPTKVVVEKKFADGWLAIQPVKGCYAAISQNYVDVADDGKTGTVTADNVYLRATGKMRQRDFHSVLCKLQKGDKVRIVGRAEDDKGLWHIVKPTGKALFYISAKYVKPVSQALADETAAAPEETTKEEPAEETETKVTESEKIVEIPQPENKTETIVVDKKITVEEETVIKDVPAAPAEPTAIPLEKTKVAEKPKIRTEADLLKQIGGLEKLLVDECKKPSDKRDLDMLKAKADEIDVPKSSRFRPVYDSLVSYIDSEIALREEARETEALVKQALADSKKTPTAKVEEKAKPATSSYDLTGRLEISKLWKYGSDSDRQYILRDPQTRDFLGYVSAANSDVDLGGNLGQIVGVSGKVDYNKTTGGRVLKVTSMDILDESPVGGPTYATKTPVKTLPEAKQPEEKVLTPDVPVEQPIEVAKVPEETPAPAEAAPREEAPKAPEATQDVLPIPSDEDTVAAKPKTDDSSMESKLLVPVIEKPKLEDVDMPEPKVTKTEPDLPLNIEPDNKIANAENIAPVKKPDLAVPEYKDETKVVKFESSPKKADTEIAEKPVIKKPVIETPKLEPPVEPTADKAEAPITVTKSDVTEPELKMPEITPPAETPAEKPIETAKVPEPTEPKISEPELKIPELTPPAETPAEKPIETAKVSEPAEPKISEPELKIPELTPPSEVPSEVAKADKPEPKPTITEPVLPKFDEADDDIELKSLDTPDTTMKIAKPESLDVPSPEEKTAAAEVKTPEPQEPVVAVIPKVDTPVEPRIPSRKPRPTSASLPGFNGAVKAKATVIEGEYEIEWD